MNKNMINWDAKTHQIYKYKTTYKIKWRCKNKHDKHQVYREMPVKDSGAEMWPK